MNHLPGKVAPLGKWLRREYVAARPVFLFFLIGFLILLLIVKLAVAKFDIEIKALSSAVVGALLAAKTALILDETPLARHLDRYRRIVAVAVKSSLYGVITLLLGCLERVLEAHHRLHSFDAAVRDVIGQASLSRLLAWALGVTLVFGLYFASSEINERMGAGELWNLFFESPKIAGKSSQPVVPVGNVRN
jgi:uncharacterized membrane protein YcfT